MDNLITMTSNHFDSLHSGNEIAKIFAKIGAKTRTDLPYASYPFGGFTSKATALSSNLHALEREDQFHTIKELCEGRLKVKSGDSEAKEILDLLIANFGLEYGDENLDRNIIEETKTWLTPYPLAKKEYEKAMEAYDSGNYDRHTLDSIRLSLELFMKELLENKKSLENQKIDQELLPLLQKHGVSIEIRNLIRLLFGGLSSYQNEHVKHNSSFEDVEVEYVIEQTSILMKLITKAIN